MTASATPSLAKTEPDALATCWQPPHQVLPIQRKSTVEVMAVRRRSIFRERSEWCGEERAKKNLDEPEGETAKCVLETPTDPDNHS